MTQHLKFGLQPYFEQSLGFAPLNNIFKIRQNNYVVTSRSGIYIISKEQQLKMIPLKFSCSVFIERYGLIAGVTDLGSELIILSLNYFKYPILRGFKLDQIGIFHILYSSRDDCLITVGSGIKVWSMKVFNSNRPEVRPSVEITLRSSFAPFYEASIINPPIIISESSSLILPTSRGYVEYGLDGNEKKICSKLPVSQLTAMDYNPQNQKIIHHRDSDGFIVWRQGILSKRIPETNSPLSVRYCLNGFIIYLDRSFRVFLLDLKSGRTFNVLSFKKKPSRFIVDRDHLFLLEGSNVYAYTINSIWTMWAPNTTKVLQIMRIPKYHKAARVVLQLTSHAFTVISPKTRKPLTMASPSNPSDITSFTYDRGTNHISHDLFFILHRNQGVSLFSTGESPMVEEALPVDLHGEFLTTVYYNETLAYAMAAETGELFIFEYETMKPIDRFLIEKNRIVNMMYCDLIKSLVLIFEDSMALFSLEQKKVMRTYVSKNKRSLSFLNDTDLIFAGPGEGEISKFSLTRNSITKVSHGIFHTSEITSFSHSTKYFVSTGLDGLVHYFDYNLNTLFTYELPFPIFSCAFLSGKCDLLVGNDNEVVLIPCPLFEEEIEDDGYDPLNVLDDELSRQVLSKISKSEVKENEDLLLKTPPNEEVKSNQKLVRFKGLPVACSKKSITEEIIEEDDQEEKKKIIAEMKSIGEDMSVGRPNIIHKEESAFEEKVAEIVIEQKEEKVTEKSEVKKKKKKKKVKKVRSISVDQVIEVESQIPKIDDEDDMSLFMPKPKIVEEQPVIVEEKPKRSYDHVKIEEPSEDRKRYARNRRKMAGQIQEETKSDTDIKPSQPETQSETETAKSDIKLEEIKGDRDVPKEEKTKQVIEEKESEKAKKVHAKSKKVTAKSTKVQKVPEENKHEELENQKPSDLHDEVKEKKHKIKPPKEEKVTKASKTQKTITKQKESPKVHNSEHNDHMSKQVKEPTKQQSNSPRKTIPEPKKVTVTSPKPSPIPSYRKTSIIRRSNGKVAIKQQRSPTPQFTRRVRQPLWQEAVIPKRSRSPPPLFKRTFYRLPPPNVMLDMSEIQRRIDEGETDLVSLFERGTNFKSQESPTQTAVKHYKFNSKQSQETVKCDDVTFDNNPDDTFVKGEVSGQSILIEESNGQSCSIQNFKSHVLENEKERFPIKVSSIDQKMTIGKSKSYVVKSYQYKEELYGQPTNKPSPRRRQPSIPAIHISNASFDSKVAQSPLSRRRSPFVLSQSGKKATASSNPLLVISGHGIISPRITKPTK